MTTATKTAPKAATRKPVPARAAAKPAPKAAAKPAAKATERSVIATTPVAQITKMQKMSEAEIKQSLSKYEGAYECYLELRDMQRQSMLAVLQYHYRVGEVGRDRWKKHDRSDKGTKAICEALQVEPDQLTRAVKMVEMYSREEFKKIAESDRFSWTAMRLLVGVGDPKKRHQIEEKMLLAPKRIGWRDLNALIQKVMGGNRSNAYKNTTSPNSLAKQVTRITSMTDQWNANYDSTWLTNLMPRLDSLPEAATKDLVTLEASLDAIIERAQIARDRIHETLAATESMGRAATNQAIHDEEQADKEDPDETADDDQEDESPEAAGESEAQDTSEQPARTRLAGGLRLRRTREVASV